MNHVVFNTGGDWGSTTLSNNGVEVAAAQLYVELHAGRDMDGAPARGGVADGGEINAYVRTQTEQDVEQGLFPGRLEMRFPGHSLDIENMQPGFAFEFTRIHYNGRDVTNNVLDIIVNVDAISNAVQAYITLYRAHWLSADEVATYNIL